MNVHQVTDPHPELSNEEQAAEIRKLLKSEPLPMIQKSIEAFRRDLPQILKSHRGKWVAYHGDERIGFGKTQTELYRKCFRRGLTRDDFMVCGVNEGTFDPDDVTEVSPGL